MNKQLVGGRRMGMNKQLIGGRRIGRSALMIQELGKQNAELRSDIQQVITESAQVLKASVELIAFNARLKTALASRDEPHCNYFDTDCTIAELLAEDPTHSLNIIEAGGIKKAVHQLCLDNISVTMLTKYANELEEQ